MMPSEDPRVGTTMYCTSLIITRSCLKEGGLMWEIRVIHRKCSVAPIHSIENRQPVASPHSILRVSKRPGMHWYGDNWKCVCVCVCVYTCTHTHAICMQIEVRHCVSTFLLTKSHWCLGAVWLEIIEIYSVISAFRIFIFMNWINPSLVLSLLICNVLHSPN